jgi:hypothetical protein
MSKKKPYNPFKIEWRHPKWKLNLILDIDDDPKEFLKKGHAVQQLSCRLRKVSEKEMSTFQPIEKIYE